ncbi:alpha/beta fold hydrolase [Nocardia fusca]|uniref:alpha/beta fold hydrolase n=1 Tax=Nocardia fusca TaxID=941183 RepID=UPI0037A1DA90
MPGSAVPMGAVLDSMTERGFRVITYSRAGYGASSHAVGRTVADTAADCAFLLTHLGVTRYLVVGWSAGGPHALAARGKRDRSEGVRHRDRGKDRRAAREGASIPRCRGGRTRAPGAAAGCSRR